MWKSTILAIENGRTCKTCQKHFPLSEYPKTKKGYVRSKSCKKCFNRRNSTPYEGEHKLRTQQRSREYARNNPRRFNRSSDESYAKQKEKLRIRYLNDEEFRLRAKENAKKYRLENPDKEAARKKSRRARQRSATGKFTAQEWLALCARYNHKCVACKKSESLTADHVIPVSKGGSSFIDNIQPLCRSCNSKKHDKTIDYR